MNDGGPAFPKGDDSSPQDGMSLRDWLMAHAPLEPQWHFEPAMPTPRPEAVKHENSEWPANTNEIQAWDDECAKQRAIKWPWVWADAMLAERQKGNP